MTLPWILFRLSSIIIRYYDFVRYLDEREINEVCIGIPITVIITSDVRQMKQQTLNQNDELHLL